MKLHEVEVLHSMYETTRAEAMRDPAYVANEADFLKYSEELFNFAVKTLKNSGEIVEFMARDGVFAPDKVRDIYAWSKDGLRQIRSKCPDLPDIHAYYAWAAETGRPSDSPDTVKAFWNYLCEKC